MKKKEDNIFDEGYVFFIDKPLYWTSFAVVRQVRNMTKAKKVGHAGTLDPYASGLLIICTGIFTKRLNEYMAQEKEYTGTITLGATTATYDAERAPENIRDIAHITAEMVYNVTKHFIGEIQQVPPIHSAIKQKGRRVYELAREGKEVVMEPRKVTISEFEITNLALPVIGFRVVCSTGTYIRSLANDVGAVLGCGGYLSSLCRTRIGEFNLSQAKGIEEVETFVKEKLAHQKG